MEDNLLCEDGNIRHHGQIPESDEELSPTLENFIVLTWLRLINRDLPNLVKQRYGTELRSQTLASLKPEISQALDSLLEEIHSSAEAKVLRAGYKNQTPMKNTSRYKQQTNSSQHKTKEMITHETTEAKPKLIVAMQHKMQVPSDAVRQRLC